MKDWQTYKDSGLLEAYCLGTLPEMEAAIIGRAVAEHPELAEEVERILQTLQQIPGPRPPAQGLRERVLDFLRTRVQSANSIALSNPPLIDQFSDARAWQAAVDGLEPEETSGDMGLRLVYNDAHRELFVVWLADTLEEEAHAFEDFQESFLILEGACACDFEGVKANYGAGDFFQVPSNIRHTIRNITPSGLPLKGLVQRLKAA